MSLIETPSPNFGPRRGAVIDMLVLHYTGMPTGAEALARLVDPAAAVSAHYLIDEDGTVHALVDEGLRAWHAGLSWWRGVADVNSHSIGIELVNPGHEFGYRPFPRAQIDALTALSLRILARHPIPPRNVLAHSDVAPTRKTDPGELFPWQEMAAKGIGLWPEPRPETPPETALAEWGYDIQDPFAATAAFQRRYRPARIDGRWDQETAGRLADLLAKL